MTRRRKAASLSVEQVAELAGVSVSYLRDIEGARGGDFGPGVFALMRVAAALQTTLDSLVGAEGANLDGMAVVDDEHVAIVEQASDLADLEPIRVRKRFAVGVFLTSTCRVVPARELEEIDKRVGRRIEELQVREEDAQHRKPRRRRE